MIALRAWASLSAKDFNNKQDFTDPSLLAMETVPFQTAMPATYSDDAKAGLQYPGPLPFTPVAVTKTSPTETVVSTCLVGQGFAISPATNQPVGSLSLLPGQFTMSLSNGHWLVADSEPSTTVSCANVSADLQKW